MTAQTMPAGKLTVPTLTVHTAFFPASAERSYHVFLGVGDVLVVEKDHEFGVTTRLNGVLCFLLEEEIYKYCTPRTVPHFDQT